VRTAAPIFASATPRSVARATKTVRVLSLAGRVLSFFIALTPVLPCKTADEVRAGVEIRRLS
jgi:hypothetical protein